MTGLAEAVSQVKRQQQENISSLRAQIASSYPNTVKALHMIDAEYSLPKRRKGFNLVKVESKKHGFLFYARFSNNGKMLPTKFNTHTNDLGEAEKFARENKSRLVEGYLQRKDGRIYDVLEGAVSDVYYTRLSEKVRKSYCAVIKDKFVPFLKLEKTACFEQITVATLHKFQDYLLALKMKPQTVNNNMKAVKRVLASMSRKGLIKDNPGDCLKGVAVNQEDRTVRGCYELDKIKGVFNKRWADDTALLLSLLIYATGMRNCEISRMRLGDVINIGGCRFIWVEKSKTPSGTRMVPLHEFVYRKMKSWAVKNNRSPQASLFGSRRADIFMTANSFLREKLGVSETETKAENITFYSGRHFWKTLMNSEGLGEDIEEIFMGHKVSSNVAKLYNHRDKQGKKNMVKKAKQVFSILDRCIFKKQNREGLPSRSQGRRGSIPRKTTPKRANRTLPAK